MKITVIFTGGTISSTAGSDGYISPDEDKPLRLLDMYQKLYREKGENSVLPDFQIKKPFQVLSENMSADYLNCLIAYIEKILEENESSGIIVTHGTDTLQYTAAVLSYVFGVKCVPIMLVSSDFPLEDDRANGLINFCYAVDFIRNGYGRGVFACYCNQGETPVIHRGTRLQGHIPYSASMYSIKNSYYGKYEKDGYLPNRLYTSAAAVAASNIRCYNCMADLKEDNFIKYKLCDNNGEIMWIRPFVGMNYPVVTEKTKAVLHDSYHSGTIGISGELKDFMRQAEIQGISVYITGAGSDEKNYETVREYQKLGICILPQISPIAAYCKLWLALSNGLDVEQVMKACIADDIC